MFSKGSGHGRRGNTTYTSAYAKTAPPIIPAEALAQVHQFLDQEKTHNNQDTWSRVNRPKKIEKLMTFVDSIYARDHELTEEEVLRVKQHLRECVANKKMLRVKDVVCDKTTGAILAIPGLLCGTHKSTGERVFTLRMHEDADKSSSSLTPKKRAKSGEKGASTKRIRRSDRTTEVPTSAASESECVDET